MLALTPQISSISCLLDNPMSHLQHENPNFLCIETSDSIDLQSPTSVIQAKNSEFADDVLRKGDSHKINNKKLNHNASERDRRKKLNTLYSTLRSLLPQEDQSRKLSIPSTVERVVKYIPELQKELEILIQKKESLISKIPRKKEPLMDFEKQLQKMGKKNPLTAISITQISDQEIIVQSSMPKIGKGSISEALSTLENEGFLVLNASCFESIQGRVFCDLHLQAEEGKLPDFETLRQKLLSFYESGEEINCT